LSIEILSTQAIYRASDRYPFFPSGTHQNQKMTIFET
jgi:hypothetical protein